MDKDTRIAVIYSTTDGQTRKVADYIATHLKEMNHRVELFDAKEVPQDLSLEEFDGVILGGRIHAGGYPRVIRKYARANSDVLSRIPSAFFSVSLSEAEDNEESRKRIEAYLERFIAKTSWHPVIFASFAGALPFSRYGFIKRMMMRAAGRSLEGDKDFDTSRDYEYTDWSSVDEFVEQFLGLVASSGGREVTSQQPAAP